MLAKRGSGRQAFGVQFFMFVLFCFVGVGFSFWVFVFGFSGIRVLKQSKGFGF